MNLKSTKIAIIGQGYVGLPLSLEFAKHFPTVGYDISKERIDDLRNAKDYTKESTSELISTSLQPQLNLEERGYFPTNDIVDIADCTVYIVTVPTPIDESKRPNLAPLKNASESLGGLLKKGDVVIYESTTFPGCTEEICVPILEKKSGLKLNIDFYVGYSPERINPGDKINTLPTIKKVTSGSNEDAAEFIDHLYKTIITAGTHKAPSIKVAEASKAIENAQRDVNISFVNELAIIFDKIGINTSDVLEAASTKWNFLPYKPGLVGGHCISVDPYYLAYKAEKVGYIPNVILSGRRVNDQMGSFIANKVVKLMIDKGILIKNSQTLILGITFKENCPDIRNTKVIDIHHEISDFGSNVTIFDPWANPEQISKEYAITSTNQCEDIKDKKFDAIILAVAHDEFKNLDIQALKTKNGIIYDCKGVLDKETVDARL